MASDFSDNDEINQSVAETHRQQDFDDLQNEIAGRETGRSSRFIGKGNAEVKESERKRNSERVQQTALEIMLQNDSTYATLYSDIMELIRQAEIQAEELLGELEAGLASAQDTMKETLDNSNKLPDGTAVFKDTDGNIWTENGRKVGPEEAAGIEWKDGDVSYEDYLKQKQAIEDFKRRIDEVHHYQVDVLGRARDRMTDPDNPPSMDDLNGIKGNIKNTLNEVLNHNEANASNMDVSIQKSVEVKLPTLGS